MSISIRTAILWLGISLIPWASGCGSHKFQEPKIPTETAPLTPVDGSEDAVLNPENPVDESTDEIKTPVLPPVVEDPIPVACSSLYAIPGTSNPFLAGMPSGTEIAYPRSVDRAPTNSPILIVPTDKACLEAGRSLYFRVEGTIAHGSNADQISDADGIAKAPMTHTLGSVHGISDIKAPINSLIGVFLDGGNISQRPVVETVLDFSSSELRDFRKLSPELGQIFFIGDGKDAKGKLQSFVVPQGAKELYLAIMDQYEWNNNLGKLTGGILWVKP